MVQALRPTPALHRYVLALCVLACLAVGLSAPARMRPESQREKSERERERALEERWALETPAHSEPLLERLHKLRD